MAGAKAFEGDFAWAKRGGGVGVRSVFLRMQAKKRASEI